MTGTTVAGATQINGSNASLLFYPNDVAIDNNNNIFVADTNNNRIQLWISGSLSGVTVAGDETAGSNSTELCYPHSIFVNTYNNSNDLYVADHCNNRIQKYPNGANTGTTVAGGNGPGVDYRQINGSYGVYVTNDNTIYISDTGNDRVMKWLFGSSVGLLVAGAQGTGSASNQFDSPRGLFVISNGDVYVADNNNHRIQRWTYGASNGTTVAGGNGAGNSLSQLTYPRAVIVDEAGGDLYISDTNNHRIMKWKIGATSGIVIAGSSTGTAGSTATTLYYPNGISLDSNQNLYVADSVNHRIQEFQAYTSKVVTGLEILGRSGQSPIGLKIFLDQ
ncbi:unnamed protein product [Didymodactylos carnosus]|uniref:NHL repeat containing protein n=1 Tax=Didymodactylos carnosus TaxID=1234261 RepID=A0A8S2UXA2_9BILA|nr:unnamed protein product [Didymodactylos carnosus]CAF4359990.1 unnamed protein product [Didymodactylos carnosus]